MTQAKTVVRPQTLDDAHRRDGRSGRRIKPIRHGGTPTARHTGKRVSTVDGRSARINSPTWSRNS